MVVTEITPMMVQCLSTDNYTHHSLVLHQILMGMNCLAEVLYVCTCDRLSPNLGSCYFDSGGNDTDVVVSPLYHITDSQHSSLHSPQEWLLHWDQLEASTAVMKQTSLTHQPLKHFVHGLHERTILYFT
jgi:hypothetical protein